MESVFASSPHTLQSLPISSVDSTVPRLPNFCQIEHILAFRGHMSLSNDFFCLIAGTVR